MKKFAIYKQVLGKIEYLTFVGYIMANNRNEACINFRQGEYNNAFLTAKEVL
jgi:putative heme degradation protein